MRVINNPDTFRKNIRSNLNEFVNNEIVSINLEKAI